MTPYRGNGKGQDMDDGFETVEIAVKDAPDIRFKGRLIASISSRDEHRQAGRDKARWTELEVYELRSGNWVAAAIGCSDKPDEIDVAEPDAVRVIACEEPIDSIDDWLKKLDKKKRPETAMQMDVMKAFGWTWLAKKLAAQEGWDVVRTIA